LREGLGVGMGSREPTPLRLASKLASLATPPASGRGVLLANRARCDYPRAFPTQQLDRSEPFRGYGDMT